MDFVLGPQVIPDEDRSRPFKHPFEVSLARATRSIRAGIVVSLLGNHEPF